MRHAPGRFEAFDRLGEIEARRRLPLYVDKTEIGQRLGEGAEQEPARLHGAEVFAVDPDEIGGAVLLSRLHLVAHPAHHFSRVGDLHMDEVDAETRQQFRTRPGDIGVNGLGTRPGVEVNGLTFRLRLDGRPTAAPGLKRHQGDRHGRREQRPSGQLSRVQDPLLSSSRHRHSTGQMKSHPLPQNQFPVNSALDHPVQLT